MASNDAAPHKQKKLTILTKFIRERSKNRRNRDCLASDAFGASFSQLDDIDFFPRPGTTSAFREIEREEKLLAEDELKVKEDLKVEEDVTYDEEEFLSAEEELKVELSYKGETEIELQVYDDSYPIPEKVKNSNPSQENDRTAVNEQYVQRKMQQKTGQNVEQGVKQKMEHNVEQDVREPVMNPKIENINETGSKALGMNDLWDAAIDVAIIALDTDNYCHSQEEQLECVYTQEQLKNSNPSQESGTTAAAEPVKIAQVANINETGSKALGMNDLWDAAIDVAIIALDTDNYCHTQEEQLECVHTQDQLKNSNPSQESGTTAAAEPVKREQVANINQTGSKALEMNDLWDAVMVALDTDNYCHTKEEQLKNSNPSQENITKTEDAFLTVVHVKHHSPATSTQRKSWDDAFMRPPEGSHRHPPRVFWAYLLISVN